MVDVLGNFNCTLSRGSRRDASGAEEEDPEILHFPFVFTEHIWNSKANRAKLYELIFEEICKTPSCLVEQISLFLESNIISASQLILYGLGLDKMQLLNHSFCSLVSEGASTGLVIDSGELATAVVPIYDSRILSKLQMSLHL